MTLTNFRDFKKGAAGTERLTCAIVDVTVGRFLWKRTTTRKVACMEFWTWFFADTGEYIPEDLIQPAIRVWRAREESK